MTSSNKQFAMLIDGDNAEAKLTPKILEAVNRYGEPIIRRIYGDWTQPQMNSWKSTLNAYSIQPIQQFRYTTGKNATDSALIIDAMDILYTSDVNGFCIVSSDSDYTRLAQRIRENNLFVLGVGRNNTPLAFVNACNEFIFTESFKNSQNNQTKSGNRLKKIEKLLAKAVTKAPQKDGWTDFGALGKEIKKADPNFNRKAYGYSQLLDLLQDYQNIIEIRKKGTVYSVRLRS